MSACRVRVERTSPNDNSSPVRLLQPKLSVSEPGDPYEREADRIADVVMGSGSGLPDAGVGPGASGARGTLSRSCAGCEGGRPCQECEEERGGIVQPKRSQDTHEDGPWVSEGLLDGMGPGVSLDRGTKEFMESRFGYDFGRVRVHAGQEVSKSAESIGALAYTVGNDIVFAAGRYDVVSERGRKLLAHELAHVVQQGSGPSHRSGKTVQRAYGPPDPDEESRCGQPTDLIKITRTKFQGGKKLDDYYGHPANGEWLHGDTGGPYDTGQYAGSNIQIVGTIGSKCDSSKFNFEQTVTYKKYELSGQKHPDEGKTNVEPPVPHRQEWFDPSGPKVSTADTPSVDYKTNVGSSLDLERDFTTSLKGPSGSKAVNWSTSIFVQDGKVKRNTIS